MSIVDRYRFDIATAPVGGKCGPGWEGIKGKCRRAAVVQRLRRRVTAKRLETGKHVGVHLGENVAAWSVGKIGGGALAAIAIQHGHNPQLAHQVAESAVQALSATVLHARKAKNRTPAELTQKFISEAVGAFAGKFAHSGVDDAILGGDDQLRMIASTVAGKGTGASTVMAASHTLKRQGMILNRLVQRLAPDVRTDSYSEQRLCGQGWQGTLGQCQRAKGRTALSRARSRALNQSPVFGKKIGYGVLGTSTNAIGQRLKELKQILTAQTGRNIPVRLNVKDFERFVATHELNRWYPGPNASKQAGKQILDDYIRSRYGIGAADIRRAENSSAEDNNLGPHLTAKRITREYLRQTRTDADNSPELTHAEKVALYQLAMAGAVIAAVGRKKPANQRLAGEVAILSGWGENP
jgi:hypothetical protein